MSLYNINTASVDLLIATGSLFGSSSFSFHSITASYVTASSINGSVPSASYSLTASFAMNGGSGGTSLATGSTYPFTASWAQSASFAISASWAPDPFQPGTMNTGSDYPITASWADNTTTASYALAALSSSYAITCSFTSIINIQQLITTQSFYSTQSLYATQSLFATQSISASYALTASYAVTASYLIYPSQIITVNSGSTGSLLSITSSIYNSIFMSYILNDFQNFRAGNVVLLYTTSSTVWAETCTTDIGNSDVLKLSASLSASFLNVYAVNAGTPNYSIKYHYDLM